MIHTSSSFYYVPRGWTAQDCPYCQCVQPFTLFDRRCIDRVYFIKVMDRPWGVVTVCDFCGATIEHDGRMQMVYSTDWESAQGLQTLVDQTNPHLGRILCDTKTADQELRALLNQSRTKAMAAARHLTIWTLVGALLGLAIAVSLSLLADYAVFSRFHIDGTYFMAGLCSLSIIAGAVLATRIRSRQIARKNMLNALRTGISKHHIDLDRLAMLSLEFDAPIREAVERLRAGMEL